MTEAKHPWAGEGGEWWAALVSAGQVYGVVRLVDDGKVARYEELDRETGKWVKADEGPAYFTEIGGTTDAVPVTPEDGARMAQELLAKPPAAS